MNAPRTTMHPAARPARPLERAGPVPEFGTRTPLVGQREPARRHGGLSAVTGAGVEIRQHPDLGRNPR